MSASTEQLLETIKHTEETLAIAEANGQEATIQACRTTLEALHKQFHAATQALNEGKQVIKG